MKRIAWQSIGAAGFAFFLIKGLVWLAVAAAAVVAGFA